MPSDSVNDSASDYKGYEPGREFDVLLDVMNDILEAIRGFPYRIGEFARDDRFHTRNVRHAVGMFPSFRRVGFVRIAEVRLFLRKRKRLGIISRSVLSVRLYIIFTFRIVPNAVRK